MRRIVVTGAARGLGLEFVRQFLELGDGVIAITRGTSERSALEALRAAWPNTLHTREVDVTCYSDVAEFGKQLAPLPVDILINNAGQIGPETHKGELGQSVESLDITLLERLFSVNAIAPLFFTQALIPSLRLTGTAKTFVMGSTIGVAAETFGDYYGYRMSKAAAHIAFATLAKDLARFSIKAGIICPGWVRTALGGPNAQLDPADSVRMMIQVMLDFADAQNGKFISFDGRVLPF